MGDRQIIVGGSTWQLPAGDVAGILKQIQRALEVGTVTRLDLLDADGRAVTVYVNGAAADTVVIWLGGRPRPSEISGSAMPARHLRVGGSTWQFPAGDVTGALGRIENAFGNGSVAQLELHEAVGGDVRAVTVYLNGRTAQTVEVDLDGGPRPSEISG